MKESFRFALNKIKEHNGIIKTGQAQKDGIDPKILARMTNAGILVKEGKGIYRIADLPPLSNPDFVQVALKVPYGVICLLSALMFHGLTSQLPYKVYIAVPKGKKPPKLEYPPVDYVTLGKMSYSSGIELREIDGVRISIYSKEKTIVDCFKFRNKVGVDVAIEALKDYFLQPGANIQMLMEYADINRVGNIIQPYIEAML